MIFEDVIKDHPRKTVLLRRQKENRHLVVCLSIIKVGQKQMHLPPITLQQQKQSGNLIQQEIYIPSKDATVDDYIFSS